MRPTSPRNLAIQQLRGLAILLVLMQHLSLPTALLGLLPGNLANPGYTGVELFFVISGFVVMQSLQRGRWDIRHFAIRRLFRLFPAILVFIAAAFLVLAVIARWPAESFVHAVFGSGVERYAAQSFGVLTGTFINLRLPAPYVFGAVWSLSVEFQFYAAVALVALLLQRCGAGGVACARAVLGIAAAVAGVLLASRLGGWNAAMRLLDYLSFWKFEFLAAGVLLAALPTSATAQLAAVLRGRIGIALLTGVALLLIALHRSPLDLPPEDVPRPLFDLDRSGLAALLILYGAVVALAAGIADEGAGRSKAGRAMLWLGDRSYSLYLLHFPVLALLWFGLHAVDPRLVSDAWAYAVVQVLVGGPLICLAAHACYRWVEAPGIALGSGFLRGGAAPPRDAARVTAPPHENRSPERGIT